MYGSGRMQADHSSLQRLVCPAAVVSGTGCARLGLQTWWGGCRVTCGVYLRFCSRVLFVDGAWWEWWCATLYRDLIWCRCLVDDECLVKRTWKVGIGVSYRTWVLGADREGYWRLLEWLLNVSIRAS